MAATSSSGFPEINFSEPPETDSPETWDAGVAGSPAGMKAKATARITAIAPIKKYCWLFLIQTPPFLYLD
jgi:hypothetical protein